MSLWGGRFSEQPDSLAQQFNASLTVDQRLWEADIRGSLAWVRALARAGVVVQADADRLQAGLDTIRAEFRSGAFKFRATDEDIHTAVERRLGEIIGPVAGKLHTGRSRNDQVATDFRLWVMEAEASILARVRDLQSALLAQAEAHVETLMPGYTHWQRAQPITFGHWLLGFFWALERDRARWTESRNRASTCPLGAGALAGTGFPIDRAALATDLGFARVSENSLDAVSDRDFAVEFLFDAALTASHLSRLAEGLILFSSAEFGFVTLADAYATGSSLMPQKKNPDVLELARGKAGTLIGHLTGLLATLKGLASAYDKDLQEDKPPVFAAFDTLDIMLPVVAGVVSTLSVNADRMTAALEASLLATDLAEYLVRKGVPFREAHRAVGEAMLQAAARPLDSLSLQALKGIHPAFEADVAQVWDFRASVNRRSVEGGTGAEAVRAQIQTARDSLQRQP